MGSVDQSKGTDFDIIIVGAGISGINSAYRIQENFPNYTYTVLENRSELGGTWSLFKYPGIRSDSDLHTFGFSWKPWYKSNSIASGTDIKAYMKECAQYAGIDKNILYHHNVDGANWSTPEQKWTLNVSAGGVKKTMKARFVIWGTGYYDYKTPLEAVIPGLERFKGTKIHPQFWPEDLDYKNKNVVVIGSGATAITLIPNLADKAKKVTMLQRSPGYVIAMPQKDPMADVAKAILPTSWAHKFIRLKFLILPFLFFKFCRSFPNAARNMLRRATARQLPKGYPVSPNFAPTYNPWEQRLCVCPDGDFFKCLSSGKADIVTDVIETVTEHGITTKNGTKLDADIIVTATGLKLQLAGGAKISVDGQEQDLSDKFIWRGVMLENIPNACLVIGYTNASWTLGADTTAMLVTRILKHLEETGKSSAVPRVDPKLDLKETAFLNLASTYIVKARGALPKAGDQAPFQPRYNYLTDYPLAKNADINEGLEFVAKPTKKVY